MKTALLPVLTIALLTLVGCFSDTTCATGDTCSCSLAGVCTWDCPDGGCQYVADGAGEANFTCDGGGCDLTASGTGAVIFDCLGGDCTVDATGQGDVDLTCAGGGCVVDCGGQGACTITDCDDCTCNESLTGICN